jgi:hypothetical protein
MNCQVKDELVSQLVALNNKLNLLSPDLVSAERVTARPKADSIVCTVPRGDALLMRPLLLHASSACVAPKSRRVIHLEFAADELPQGLEWLDGVWSVGGATGFASHRLPTLLLT